MSRILEYHFADEQTVVSRILLELHQTLDASFPGSAATNRQFSKTVFSAQSEKTNVDSQPSSTQTHGRTGGESLGGRSSRPARNVHETSSNFVTNDGSSPDFSPNEAAHHTGMKTLRKPTAWSIMLTKALLLLLAVGLAILGFFIYQSL